MQIFINTKRQGRIKLLIIIILEILFPYYCLVASNSNLFKLDIPQINIIIFISFWILLSYIRGRYSKKTKPTILERIAKQIKEFIIVSVVMITTIFTLKIVGLNYSFDSKNLPFIFSLLFLLSTLKEIILIFVLEKFIYKSSKKVFILGTDSDLLIIENLLTEYNHNEKIKFTIINSETKENFLPDQLIISNKYKLNYRDNKIIEYYSMQGVQIFSVNKWFEYELSCCPVVLLSDNVSSLPYLTNNKDFEFRIKRLGDILVSLLLIIFLFPIIFIAGFSIWFVDKGPIFYIQKREGMFGEEITIIKLRTMVIDAEKDGVQWAKNNDNRITSIGKILRRSRLDELPQLISVLKGEMSLIGPRPERPEFNQFLNDSIPLYNLRSWIKPGLSGWAQVNYPYAASTKDAQNKLGFDLFYIYNFSIFLDFLILFTTMKTVLSGIGSVPKI